MSAQFNTNEIKLEDPTENVTEIQSYLAGFKKEIGSDVTLEVSGISPEKDAQEFITNTEEETEEVESEKAETADNIIINTGNAYQLVSLVQSDGNSGEFSYVTIVQDPLDLKDGETDGDHDMAEDGGTVDSDIEDDKSKILKIVPCKSQVVTQAHMCNYCNYSSSKRYLLSRHMKSHSEDRPHKCAVCERGFSRLSSLENHLNTHTGTKPHGCKFCQAAFATSGELVRHVRYRHTYEKPHKCDECGFASVELSKLKRHILCHTGERPYQCPHCSYASQDSFKLKRHLQIHTGEKPYQCDKCTAKFTRSTSLKAHKLTHNVGERPIFQCEQCPSKYGRKTDLRIHVQKLHTSDVPLKCKRCGKSFPDRYSFKLHKKTHDGEKCYKCDLCPYASTFARHLKSHMLIHTDQKPFQCMQCDQSFRNKQLLKRHQNLYHNPDYIPPRPREKTHECPECSRTFRHKGNLIRHMDTHDPDPTIQRKQLELKLGRQKKIQMIDEQQVEVMPGLGSEDEDEDEEVEEKIDMISVEGSNGHQQLNEGEDHKMVVGEGLGELVGESILPDNDIKKVDLIQTLQSPRRVPKDEQEDEDEKKFDPTTQTDMLNSIGFVDVCNKNMLIL